MSDEKNDEKKTDHVFPGRVMNEVLKDLIEAAPEENQGAIDIQVVLRNGMGMIGAVRKHEKFDDVYKMDAVVTDQRGAPQGTTNIYFHGHDILRLDEAKNMEKQVDLSLPKGMGSIPGLGRRG